MKILSVGNSFSEDAQRYLHRLAVANNKDLMCVNLYIGGCPLEEHYINLTDDEKNYDFQVNGVNTHLKVSIKEIIKSNEWDYITLQQASHLSFSFESYVPYLEKINEWIRLRCPRTKILLHQTWAYPENHERLYEVGFGTTEEMFSKVREAYKKAQELIKPDGVITSGEAMLEAYRAFPDIVYRDQIHASYGFGRYLLSCIWYKHLFGEIPEKHISSFDEPVDSKHLTEINQIINRVCN